MTDADDMRANARTALIIGAIQMNSGWFWFWITTACLMFWLASRHDRLSQRRSNTSSESRTVSK